MHAAGEQAWWQRAWGLGARAGAVPGVDWLMSHATKALFTPELGVRLTARNQPSAGDLIRHAFADVPGNPNWARSWAKCARQWPRAPRRQLLELYPTMDMPVLLLWADHDAMHPLALAEEALARMPAAQLRVLEGTGFLMAYDDPVALAREITAFCG
jgi:pimeloyl-ACP methyl ester carboxylesterase